MAFKVPQLFANEVIAWRLIWLHVSSRACSRGQTSQDLIFLVFPSIALQYFTGLCAVVVVEMWTRKSEGAEMFS